MRHSSTSTLDPAVRPHGDRAVLAAGGIAVAASILAGFAQANGADRVVVLLPLLVAAGLGMAWLAMARFTLFVAAILFVRASLDALKLNPQASAIMDPAALLSGAFLIAGGLWLLVQPKEDRAPRSPLVLPLGLLAFFGALSTVSSPDAMQGVSDVVKLATVVLMLAVLNQVCRTERDTKIILGAALASAVVPLIVAAVEGALGLGLHQSGSFSRAQGTFSHPNPFSIYLCTTIVMAAGIYRYVGIRTKLALTVLLGGCAAALFFTYTRSGWISTVLGVLVVGALVGKKRMILFVVVVAAAAALAIPGIGARFSDLGTTTTQSGAAGNSLVWRFGYWRQALELNNDPLLGTGLSAVRTEGSESKEPHNDFIRAYVETGILGFGAYLWFLLRAWRVTRRAVRETATGFWYGVGAGFAGIFVAFVVLSVVSNVITQLVILWYVGTYATAAVAAPRLAPREMETDPEPALA